MLASLPPTLALVTLLLAALAVGGVVVSLTAGGSVEALFASGPEPALPTSQLEPISGEERTPLPGWSLPPLGDGPPIALGDYRGQRLLVNLWATWCVPCVTEMPILQEVSQQSRGQVTFLGMPTTLLVNESGMITYRHTGAVEAQQLRDLLVRHLGVNP